MGNATRDVGANRCATCAGQRCAVLALIPALTTTTSKQPSLLSPPWPSLDGVLHAGRD